jgi:hypothetical protein
MEVRDEEFGDYKQCGECRLKAITRKRKSVTCECGRTLLACSLKVHLRSIYHAEHVMKSLAQQIPSPVMKVPPPSKPVIRATLLKPTTEPVKKPQSRPVILQARPATQPLSANKAQFVVRS